MKKIILISTLFFTSCVKNTEVKDKSVRCVITNISYQHKYGGLVPDKVWIINTDCNMTFRVEKCRNKIGDTIDVIVRDVK